MMGAPRGRAFVPVHAHFHHLWISQWGRWETGGCQGLRESSLRADGPRAHPVPTPDAGGPAGVLGARALSRMGRLRQDGGPPLADARIPETDRPWEDAG